MQRRLTVCWLSFFLSLFFFIAANVPAEMYTWTDENGVKHFTDTPPPEQVQDLETKKTIEHSDAYYRRNRSSQNYDNDYWIRKGEARRRQKAYREKVWEIEQNSKKRRQEYDDRIKEIETNAAKERVETLENRMERYKQYERDSDYNDSYWHERARRTKKELQDAKGDLRDID